MKYIVYEYVVPSCLAVPYYARYELKNDKELKNFLFKHQNNLKNIEIFNKTNKCNVDISINIK